MMRTLFQAAIILVLSSSAYVMANKPNHGEKENERHFEYHEHSQKRHHSRKTIANANNVSDSDWAEGNLSDTRRAFASHSSNSRQDLKAQSRFTNGQAAVSNVTMPKKSKVTHNEKNVSHALRHEAFHQTRSFPAATTHKSYSNLSENIKHSYHGHGVNTGRLNSMDVLRRKIPGHHNRQKHVRTRKRTKVEQALNEERQNIANTIDGLDDIQGSYSRGLEEDGMDIKEVNMIDNNTLSDYFHALNDNGSDGTNSNNDNSASVYQQKPWDENTPTAEESGNDDFYDAIDRGDKPPEKIKMKNIHPTKSHFKKVKSKPSKYVSSTIPSSGIQSSNFRLPSREDFENFFRGMLGKYHEQRHEEDNKESDGYRQKANSGATKASDGYQQKALPDDTEESDEYHQKALSQDTKESNKYHQKVLPGDTTENEEYHHKVLPGDTTENEEYHQKVLPGDSQGSDGYHQKAHSGNTKQSDEYRNKEFSVEPTPGRFPIKSETNDKRNITAFLDSGGNMHGNVTKLVSVGDPEEVEGDREMQRPDADKDRSGQFSFKEEEVGRDGEGMESFVPSTNHAESMKQPFDSLKHPQFKYYPLLSQGRPADNVVNPPIHSSGQSQQQFASPAKHPITAFSKQHDNLLPLKGYKGTHIMGGKISGGQISGGLIEGGQIKAGLIEGGTIKGGQVVGGRMTNGTMDGGVLANGQMLGGHLVDGRIEGGLLVGGNMYGGRILGGRVEGGNLKGGVVAGGRFRGGNMQGGLLKGGEVQGGNMRGGKVEGGVLHSGNIDGGEFRFGDITGGTLKSGSMLGGELRNGSIEGGTLKGGTIEGGVLKGGVMEGGRLKGGVVLAGKIKGGVIEGGVIEGGEIGDGVIIRNGTVNATIVATGNYINRNQKLGGLFRQAENPQQLELQVNENIKPKQGTLTTNLISKANSSPLPNVQGFAKEQGAKPGLDKMGPHSQVKLQSPQETLKMVSQEGDPKDNDSSDKLLSDEKTENHESLVQRLFEEQDKPNRLIQKKGVTHHVVFDGISFDIPNGDFGHLIDKMKHGPDNLEELVSYYNQPKKKHHLGSVHVSKSKKTSTSSEEDQHIKPEDIEMKLSPTKPRSSVTRFDKSPDVLTNNSTKDFGKTKDKSVRDSPIDKGTDIKDMDGVSLKAKDNEKLRPTYHWSLNKLIKPDRIPGSPGPAIRTHGGVKVIHGGLHFNGHDAWLGAGDFSGGCISDPDTCDDGLSFEMTLRMDKDALKYNDMNYIIDSGASTFNSRGFTLYTVHGNLRADLAIANQEYCLQIPLVVHRWQDILITWKKSEGMKMYVNCALKAHTKGGEHCLGCHASGCHVTDANTLLMIGRPNYSPHFHCTKFDSGDISFWEKYLSADDVKTLCGVSTGESVKASSSSARVFPQNRQMKFPGIPMSQATPGLNGVQSYSINQPSFGRFTGLTPRVSSYAQRLFTQWSGWSSCSKTCGMGVRARRRACINPSLFIGRGLCRGLSIQHRPCFDRGCPAFTPMMAAPFIPGQYGRPFGYTRAPFYTGFPLPQIASSNVRSEPGLTRAINVEGGYSEWSAWGTCDRSCGGGAQVRTRICNRLPSKRDEQTCHPRGPAIQVRRCNRHGCPVDGGYNSWSVFSPCSKTCGTGGIQKRFRTCSNPPPTNGGKPCFGHALQTKACSSRRCPVDGGYSMWSPWSPCDADCGGGIMERNRFCSRPIPRFGGRACFVLGPGKETRLCNLFACNDFSVQGRKRFKIIHPKSRKTKTSPSELNDAMKEM